MGKAIILDMLPTGAPFVLSQNADSQLRRRGVRPVRGGYLTLPLVFALVKDRFFLIVATSSLDEELEIGNEIDLNDKATIPAWARIDYSDLSSAGKSELEDVLDKIIEENDDIFTHFFNKASPITTRLHSLELIPGIGKKHMWEIIEQRRKPFTSLNDLKERLPLVPNPKRGVKGRILKELQEDEKYNLFVLPKRR